MGAKYMQNMFCLAPPCLKRKWKSYAVLCFPSAQIVLMRILKMQSNVSSLSVRAQKRKNQLNTFDVVIISVTGIIINTDQNQYQCSTTSLTKEYSWSDEQLFKNIITGTKYFLRSQRFLSDYFPPLIDHDLLHDLIDKEQFGC